jgi:hypothetical protein
MKRGESAGERAVRRMFPGVDDIPDELNMFADGVIGAYREDRAQEVKRETMPGTYVPVGGEVEVRGRMYKCVANTMRGLPSEACTGCDLRRRGTVCSWLQCSAFDRRDGLFVWFKEVRR